MLFNEEAELINREVGLAAFHQHEQECANIPLPDGPFANLIRTIASMQGDHPDKSPFRIGLVTARNAPSHERAIRTLRKWNVRVDNGAFLGGLAKDPWLTAFGPQIFFDDQEAYCTPASRLVPTAFVPLPLSPLPSVPAPAAADGSRKNGFLLICKGYLKRNNALKTPIFDEWYAGNLAGCDTTVADAFSAELSASVEGTRRRAERPAKGEAQTAAAKFVAFLDTLLKKHQRATNAEAKTFSRNRPELDQLAQPWFESHQVRRRGLKRLPFPEITPGRIRNEKSIVSYRECRGGERFQSGMNYWPRHFRWDDLKGDAGAADPMESHTWFGTERLPPWPLQPTAKPDC